MRPTQGPRGTAGAYLPRRRPHRSRRAYHSDAAIDTAGPKGPLTDAQRDLAGAYFPLALKIARPWKLAWPRLRDEFESAACLGLVDAARDFDPARGMKFSTFAWLHVRGELADVVWASRPMGLADGARVVPLRFAGSWAIDRRMPELGSELAGLEEFDQLLRRLPARHAEVCRLYYGRGRTMAEVGLDLGCSTSEVARIHRLAIAMLSGPAAPMGLKQRRNFRKKPTQGTHPCRSPCP